MKSYRNAVILVVVLGLLFGAYTYISKKKGVDPSNNTDNNIIKILDFDTDKITEVAIDNKGEKLVFDKKDKDWILTTPSDLKYDKSKLEGIASSLSSITGDKVIDENAADLNQYGFNTPVIVAVKSSDGSVKSFELGSQTPTKEDYYIKLKDSNKVYTVASSTAETFIIGKNDIRDKTLFAFTRDIIRGFEMDKGGSLVFQTQKRSDTNWDLTAPFEATADASKLEPIFQAVTSLNVLNFVEDNVSDLSKYGLKTPSYAFEVDTTGGNTRILLGDEKVKNSEIYAKLENSNDVFTVNETALNFLDKPLKEMIDPFVFLANISDVTKLSLEMDGSTDIFDIKSEKGQSKDNDRFFVNGKDILNVKSGDKTGSDLFRKFYQGVIGIFVDDVDTQSKPTGKAEVTITYTLKEAPGTMKVEYISKDDTYYYAVKNGKYTNIIVKKSQLKDLRDARKELLDAVPK